MSTPISVWYKVDVMVLYRAKGSWSRDEVEILKEKLHVDVAENGAYSEYIILSDQHPKETIIKALNGVCKKFEVIYTGDLRDRTLPFVPQFQ